MSNGIRSLPRYQEGGGTYPDWVHPDWIEAQEQRKLRDRRMVLDPNASRNAWLQTELAASDDLAFQALESSIALTADEEKLLRARLSRGLGSLPVPQEELSWTRALGIPERVGDMRNAFPENFLELSPQQQRVLMNLRDFDQMAEVRAAILETPHRSPGFTGRGPLAGGGWPRYRREDVREVFARRNPDAPVGWEHGVETIGDVYPPGQRPMPIPPEQRPGSYESLFPDPRVQYGPGGEFQSIERGRTRPEIEDVLLEIMGPDITEPEIAQALHDPMFGGPISGTATNAEINERVYGRRFTNKMEEIFETNRARPPQQAKRRGIAGLSRRAGQAIRGALPAALKWGTRPGRLPAIAAGAGTGAVFAGFPGAAAGAITGAFFDVGTTPSALGSGELPEESRFSPEERMKYYDELTNLGRELGVGQHRPSILQLSREMNGPSIRSSYPMRRMRR